MPGVTVGGFEIERVQGDSGYFANPKRIEAQTARHAPSAGNLLFNLSHGRFGQAIIDHPVMFYHLRYFLPLLIVMKMVRQRQVRYTLGLAAEFLKLKIGQLAVSKKGPFHYVSLRRTVWNGSGRLSEDNPDMEALRRGR